jgi:hypothetical protein
MERYDLLRQIGKGSFGSCYIVRHKSEKRQFVMKKVNIEGMSVKEKKAASQEVKLLHNLNHPNIVGYKESFYSKSKTLLYIVMSYCEGGDLCGKLKQQHGRLLPEPQIWEWFLQVSLALQYLHEQKILHRDLKTQNIFLTKKGGIKLGDFGISTVLSGTMEMAKTAIGTPYYMSPELFENKPYDYKSDIWALGCVLYEMATLVHAFDARDMNGLVMKILRGSYPPISSRYSPGMRSLIERMLTKNAAARPNMNSILSDPVLRDRVATYLDHLGNVGKLPRPGPIDPLASPPAHRKAPRPTDMLGAPEMMVPAPAMAAPSVPAPVAQAAPLQPPRNHMAAEREFRMKQAYERQMRHVRQQQEMAERKQKLQQDAESKLALAQKERRDAAIARMAKQNKPILAALNPHAPPIAAAAPPPASHRHHAPPREPSQAILHRKKDLDELDCNLRELEKFEARLKELEGHRAQVRRRLGVERNPITGLPSQYNQPNVSGKPSGNPQPSAGGAGGGKNNKASHQRLAPSAAVALAQRQYPGQRLRQGGAVEGQQKSAAAVVMEPPSPNPPERPNIVMAARPGELRSLAPAELRQPEKEKEKDRDREKDREKEKEKERQAEAMPFKAPVRVRRDRDTTPRDVTPPQQPSSRIIQRSSARRLSEEPPLSDPPTARERERAHAHAPSHVQAAAQAAAPAAEGYFPGSSDARNTVLQNKLRRKEAENQRREEELLAARKVYFDERRRAEDKMKQEQYTNVFGLPAAATGAPVRRLHREDEPIQAKAKAPGRAAPLMVEVAPAELDEFPVQEIDISEMAIEEERQALDELDSKLDAELTMCLEKIAELTVKVRQNLDQEDAEDREVRVGIAGDYDDDDDDNNNNNNDFDDPVDEGFGIGDGMPSERREWASNFTQRFGTSLSSRVDQLRQQCVNGLGDSLFHAVYSQLLHAERDISDLLRSKVGEDKSVYVTLVDQLLFCEQGLQERFLLEKAASED